MSFIPDSFASYLSIQALAAAVIAWILYIAVSRLFLHPLKSFPGPRLAAVTELYAAYFEVWKDGLIVKHIEDLHRVYGQSLGSSLFVFPSLSCHRPHYPDSP